MHDEEQPSVEPMSRVECLRVIGSLAVGRVAVNGRDGAPHVVPVNYVLEDEVVVFATDDGSKFRAMIEGQDVTFQIDVIDSFHRSGWSVMIQGPVTVSVADEAMPSVLSWAGERQHLVRMPTTSISGRRIRLPEIVVDTRGYR